MNTRRNEDNPSELKSISDPSRPNEKSATVRAFAVFDPQGQIFERSISLKDELGAWFKFSANYDDKLHNESKVQHMARKLKYGYTCRPINITEATDSS